MPRPAMKPVPAPEPEDAPQSWNPADAESASDRPSPEEVLVSEWHAHGSARWRYAVTGAIFALGAPIGAMLLRLPHMAGGIPGELSEHGFFYAYQLIGTIAVFTTAGFLAGLHADRLQAERDRYLDLAQHDVLTGLPNSRFFWEQYRRAVELSRRYGSPLSLLLIDIDELKKINDGYGHRVGSAALRHVASLVVDRKRHSDVAARWGGDEFAVLMTGAGREAATRLAEQILAATRTRPLRSGRGDIHVHATIGIATSTSSATAEGLFDRADRALYAGKRGGRDQVCFSD